MGSGGGGGGIGSAVGGIIGSVVGHDAASGDRSKSQGYAEDAMNALTSIGVPPDQSKEIILQKFQQAGILTPEMEKQIDIAHSKVSEMQPANQGRNAQIQALTQLQQLGKTGLGAQDRAALNQIRDETQTALEGKRQQILQNMQARGMGGSGAELIAQLQGSQGSANQASQQGDQVAAQAQNRALQAIMNSASLGGNIQSADTQLAMNKAQAQDELNRFNTQNQMAQQQRNVASGNQAQQSNLANSQALSNANVSQANQEKYRQSNAQRQNWLDQVTRAKTQSQGYNYGAQDYANRANNEEEGATKMWTGIGGLADSGVSALAGMPSGGGGGSSTNMKNAKFNANGEMLYSGGLVNDDGTITHPDDPKNKDNRPKDQDPKKNHVDDEKADQFRKSFMSAFAQGGMVGCYADGGEVPEIAKLPEQAKYVESDNLNLKPPEGYVPSYGTDSSGGGGSGGGDPTSGLMKMLPMLAMVASKGGMVPGKAVVAGNSLKNDIVPAMVSPGEVIIPREVMRHPNAPEEAKKFVHRILGYKKS